MSFEQKLFLDPYNYYAEQREARAIRFFELNEDYDSPGFWGIFCYKEAVDVFKGVIATNKDFSLLQNEDQKNIYGQHLLNKDGDTHARLRKLTLKFFSLNAVKNLDFLIDDIVSKQIIQIQNDSNHDLISCYTRKIPMFVILNLIGINTARIDEVSSLANSILIDSILLTEDVKLKRKSAINSLITFVSELIKNKSYSEENSLIRYLINAVSEEKLSQDELIAYIIFLIVAGHETTIDLIGNALFTLLESEDIYTELFANPNSINSFIEEVLRFHSPVQRTTFRVLSQDVRISGVDLRQGDQVRVFIGSANRDEEIFENSNLFNASRNPNPHLAFGFGPHNCIGQHLARAEARIAILQIMPHLSKLRLISNNPDWKYSNFSRGLQTLHVTNK